MSRRGKNSGLVGEEGEVRGEIGREKVEGRIRISTSNSLMYVYMAIHTMQIRITHV